MSFQSTLVLGGARSGKSLYAEKLVVNAGKPKVYIATAEPLDEEMHGRIELHQLRRGDDWLTIEAPLEVSDVFTDIDACSVILLDCVTLWISNLMTAERNVDAEVKRFCRSLGNLDSDLVVVSNEVGLGIVPDNALARQFRDEAGAANQLIAEACARVVFVAAGQPMTLKG